MYLNVKLRKTGNYLNHQMNPYEINPQKFWEYFVNWKTQIWKGFNFRLRKTVQMDSKYIWKRVSVSKPFTPKL